MVPRNPFSFKKFLFLRLEFSIRNQCTNYISKKSIGSRLIVRLMFNVLQRIKNGTSNSPLIAVSQTRSIEFLRLSNYLMSWQITYHDIT